MSFLAMKNMREIDWVRNFYPEEFYVDFRYFWINQLTVSFISFWLQNNNLLVSKFYCFKDSNFP